MFSAGYDIGNFDEGRFEEAAERLVAHPFHAALEALDAYPYPVIGQLNGHAIGGGLELALACDIRIAASGIKLGMPPAKLGLIYSHTGLRRFIDVCGVANTAELFYVGRNVDVAARGADGPGQPGRRPGRARRARCWTWRPRSPPTHRCRWRATSA